MSNAAKPKRVILGLTAEDRRQDRRRRLEDAALELFASFGFAHTSIEKLCQSAGVSLSTFYNEFGTKDALFVSLYDRLLGEFNAGGDRVLAATEAQDDRIRLRTTALVQALCGRPAVGRALLIEAALVPALKDRRRIVRRAIAEMIERGNPVLAGQKNVAIGITGGVTELVIDWLVYDSDSPPETLVDRIVEFAEVVIAGVRAQA